MKLQLLLRKESRTPEGMKAVERLAKELQLKITSSGAASISIDADADQIQKLFGVAIDARPTRSVNKPIVLPIPEAMRGYVESITVAPDHQYF